MFKKYFGTYVLLAACSSLAFVLVESVLLLFWPDEAYLYEAMQQSPEHAGASMLVGAFIVLPIVSIVFEYTVEKVLDLIRYIRKKVARS